jgi:macrophage erythroblast attacher
VGSLLGGRPLVRRTRHGLTISRLPKGVAAAAARDDKLIGQGLCPICSAELNDLAKFVPYAHHTKSHVQPDLVMLPSRKARSRQLLLDDASKAGLEPNMVRDPVTQELCSTDDLKKVYIT